MQNMEYIKIPLAGVHGKGKFVLVDGDYDGEWLSGYKWYLNRVTGYAYADIEGVTVTLHKLICKVPRGMVVDHIDRDKLNNRSYNLRPATYSLSATNRTYTPRLVKNVPRESVTSTKFIGVQKKGNKYQAKFRGKYIGHFDTPQQAAIAYNEATVARYGDKAILNII